MIEKLIWFKKVKSKRQKRTFTKLWYRAWIEQGYYDFPEQPLEEFARYDAFSDDFLATILGIFPIGTLRIVYNNKEVGLPTLNDFETQKIWKTEKIFESTLIAVKKGFRGNSRLMVFLLLKRAYQLGKIEGFEGTVVAADRRLFHMLRRIGFPFCQIGKERLYQGSVTYPAYLNFEEAEKVMRKINPRIYHFFTSN